MLVFEERGKPEYQRKNLSFVYFDASASGCGSVIDFSKMVTMYAIKRGKTVKDCRAIRGVN